MVKQPPERVLLSPSSVCRSWPFSIMDDMTRALSRQVDTVIVGEYTPPRKHNPKSDPSCIGSGPSSLILSYILHGNIPVYDLDSPHPDPILHAKLKDHTNLLTADVDYLTDHFYGARFPYSTQALLVNVLLDTLIRPLGETDDAQKKTCVRWEHDPSRAVPHLVVGDTSRAGGQWVDNPVKASWDIATLSYAGMLSLPGYPFDEFYHSRYGQPLPVYFRPTRHDITDYFAAYPSHVGIADSILYNTRLQGISRSDTGFHIASHGIKCRHLVLASGIFTSMIEPRPLLQPLLDVRHVANPDEPLLVVGSGFSAADVIISAPPHQRIIHIYKWAPSVSPSPLQACHHQAYPEYAGVYRRMKLAAVTSRLRRRSSAHRADSARFGETTRDWETTYEGLPNTAIVDVQVQDDKTVVTLQSGRNSTFTRTISKLEYVVGRRGSLTYLDAALGDEICPDADQRACLTGQTLREKANESLELAPNVFAIGSLTGDSLIRFAYGGCAFAAGKIIWSDRANGVLTTEISQNGSDSRSNGTIQSERPITVPAMNGLQGHETNGYH